MPGWFTTQLEKKRNCIKKMKELLDELEQIEDEIGKRLDQSIDEENEKLSSLSRHLDGLDKSVTDGFNELKGYIETWGKDYQQQSSRLLDGQNDKIAVLDGRLEELVQKLNGVEEDKNARIQNLEEENAGLAKVNKDYLAENGTLKEKVEELNDRLEKEALSEEDKEAFRIYKQFRAWDSGEKAEFVGIREDSFWQFEASCMKDTVLDYIYEGIGKFVYSGEDEEGIRLMDDVVNFCIRLRNNVKGENLQRQCVRENDAYVAGLHQKCNDSLSTGWVQKVLFQGVQNSMGEVSGECKAFIEIKNSEDR